MKTQERALKMIAESCGSDIPTAYVWADWCREVAQAGVDDDSSDLDDLEAQMNDWKVSVRKG